MGDDLTGLGFSTSTVTGFYSDNLSSYGDSGTPICQTSPNLAVVDAVHLGIAADWNSAGWAVAQVWPDGVSVGTQAIGRVTANSLFDVDYCAGMLNAYDDARVFASSEQPAGSASPPTMTPRELVSQVGRSSVSFAAPPLGDDVSVGFERAEYSVPESNDGTTPLQENVVAVKVLLSKPVDDPVGVTVPIEIRKLKDI